MARLVAPLTDQEIPDSIARDQELDEGLDAKQDRATLDAANQLYVSTAAGTVTKLDVPVSTVVGRASSGAPRALTVIEARNLFEVEQARSLSVRSLLARAEYAIDARWSGLLTPPDDTVVDFSLRNLSPYAAARDVLAHATPSKRPLKKTRNGLPVFRTDGVDDQPQVIIEPLALPVTHVWVGAWISGDFIIDAPSGATTSRHSLRQVSGQFQMFNSSGGSINLGAATTGVWAIVVAIHNGTSSKGWRNGGAAVTSGADLSHLWGGASYGANWATTGAALASADTLAHWVFSGLLSIHAINLLGVYYRDLILQQGGAASWTTAS